MPRVCEQWGESWRGASRLETWGGGGAEHCAACRSAVPFLFSLHSEHAQIAQLAESATHCTDGLDWVDFTLISKKQIAF